MPSTNSKPATEAVPLAGKKVLVVDDNAINLDIASETLQLGGATVDCAISGDEAIEMVGQKGYDLIVLDLSMPGTDGLAVGRAIRSSRDNARSSILVFTACDSAEAERAVRDLNAQGLVQKPVDTDELLRVATRHA
jgi:two-component system sensor histidine kinase/response regulator